jgi:hypothetical protein
MKTMALVKIEIDVLHTRILQIQRLLNPLRPLGRPVACDICRHQFAGCKVIAAHQGMLPLDYYDEFRFNTFVSGIWAQYYEFWKPCDTQNKLILNRAYLNIHIENRETNVFDKLISLHCDPHEEGTTLQCLYKQGPHFHVQKAEHPIPKCHFPLNLTDLDKVLSSIKEITSAMGRAIQVICDELLERYKDL